MTPDRLAEIRIHNAHNPTAIVTELLDHIDAQSVENRRLARTRNEAARVRDVERRMSERTMRLHRDALRESVELSQAARAYREVLITAQMRDQLDADLTNEFRGLDLQYAALVIADDDEE